MHTVYTFLVRESLVLLCPVPVKDQPIPERQGSSSVGGTGSQCISCSAGSRAARPICAGIRSEIEASYNSSQLYKERARVVSMCLTHSFCEKYQPPAS
jgi:hypothetical protein